MENKNYYDILGVDKNASEGDIKKAYKKAAVKWHPDRWSTKSDSEKKNAEEKFKEIGEAYSVLSDPQKKQQYDMFGTVDGQNGFNAGGFEGFSHMGDMFRDFFAGGHARRGPEPGETVQVQVPLTVEEIFCGCEKEIEVNVNVRGNGDIQTCPHCHGTGMITEIKQQGFMTMQTSHPCPHCHGTGKLGSFKQEKRKIKVKFKGGVQEGEYQILHRQGSESADKNAPAGDIIVVPVYKFDKSKYRIVANNVYELIDVPYYDCILGAHKTSKLPNGDMVSYDIPTNAQDTQQVILYGKGIRNGNYIYIIHTTMPTTMLNKEIELLKQIQQLHK